MRFLLLVFVSRTPDTYMHSHTCALVHTCMCALTLTCTHTHAHTLLHSHAEALLDVPRRLPARPLAGGK